MSTVHRGDTVTYAIAVHNPNTSRVTLRKVRDLLPRRFRYVRGSTTGAYEPVRPRQRGRFEFLTWRGPLSVPARGDLVITFVLRTGAHRGCFTDAASAVAADPYTVTGTGPTAPVCVTRGRRGDGDSHHHHGDG